MIDPTRFLVGPIFVPIQNEKGLTRPVPSFSLAQVWVLSIPSKRHQHDFATLLLEEDVIILVEKELSLNTTTALPRDVAHKHKVNTRHYLAKFCSMTYSVQLGKLSDKCLFKIINAVTLSY